MRENTKMKPQDEKTRIEKTLSFAKSSWHAAKRLCIKCMTTAVVIFGNGPSVSAMPQDNGGKVPLPLTEVTAQPSVNPNTTKNTSADASTEKNHFYSMKAQTEEELISDILIAEKKNILANFDLSNRTFSADELQMIGQCEQSERLQKIARKTAKSRRPAQGEQTYCLGGVKRILAQENITLDAQRFAYRAVNGLQNNEHFVEIDTQTRNFNALPDATVIAWEKGTTSYGHIAMKIGQKEYCDFVYNLRTNHRRGNSGQVYGKGHTFVLKDMTLDKELLKTLIREGRLDQSMQKQCLAAIKIQQMKDKMPKLKWLQPNNYAISDWEQLASNTYNTQQTDSTDQQKQTPQSDQKLQIKDILFNAKNNQSRM